MGRPKESDAIAEDERWCMWVPEDGKSYALARAADGKESDDPDKRWVTTLEGSDVLVERMKCFPTNPINLDGVEDNTMLMHLHEPGLLHNLQCRYLEDQIYSYTAYILIAVNPYKDVSKGMYGMDMVKKYRGKSIGVLPPHVFAVSDRAYRMMRAERHSQAVLISGESGAGKTETSKLVMKYLAAIAGRGLENGLEDKIIQSNPILEGFGNAKTLRNNNSSRFGKFTQIHFDDRFLVNGASIVTYLLEKSRVVYQSEGERNYHVFYQLVTGASAELKAKLKLGSLEDFHYLNQSGCTEVEGIDDVRDYNALRKAMDVIGMPQEEQTTVLSIVAGILHLGNIRFEEGAQGNAVIADRTALENACELFQVSVEVFEKGITTRIMRSRSASGSFYEIPLKSMEAVYSRDALAKAIYDRLFSWLVDRINVSLNDDDTPLGELFIGVLDIFGFESFAVNGFEQLCINFTNEKLQQHFNQQVFKQEQDIYEREGIKFQKISYQDNQDCIDLIDGRPMGVLALLDEQCKIPRGSDTGFAQSVFKSLKKYKKLQEPAKMKGGVATNKAGKGLNKDEAFVVRHFAGDVCYTVDNFLDKNNDTLQHDLLLAVMESSSELLLSLFPEHADLSDKKKGPRFSSVSNKFSKQLEQLMHQLHVTTSHFIRCIKPNMQQKAGIYDRQAVMTQLRCSGMMDALRLMHEGFPTRCPYDDLYDRYKSFMPPIVAALDSTSFTEALLMALEIDRNEFQLGITRVFFRAGKLAFLDDLTGADYEVIAPDIADKVRRWLIKKRWKKSFVSSIAHSRMQRRMEQLRAFRKLQSCAVTMFYINCTWFRLLKRIRIFRAAATLQKLVRQRLQVAEFAQTRSRVVLLQKIARASNSYKEHQPKIKEAIEERKRRLAEMAEAQKQALEQAKKDAQEKSKNKQEARKRHLEEERASKRAAVPGKCVFNFELLLNTDVPAHEYHKLEVVHKLKDVMADVLQIDKASMYLLTVKSGEGSVILKMRIVVDAELEEEKSDLFKDAVGDDILAQSLTQAELKTSSVAFAVKLETTVVAEGANNAAAAPGPDVEQDNEEDNENDNENQMVSLTPQQQAMLFQQMQMQQQQSGSEIKDARLELRLRTLERETKELRKALDDEKTARDKMEKQMKEMQRQMAKQAALIDTLMQGRGEGHVVAQVPAEGVGRSRVVNVPRQLSGLQQPGHAGLKQQPRQAKPQQQHQQPGLLGLLREQQQHPQPRHVGLQQPPGHGAHRSAEPGVVVVVGREGSVHVPPAPQPHNSGIHSNNRHGEKGERGEKSDGEDLIAHSAHMLQAPPHQPAVPALASPFDILTALRSATVPVPKVLPREDHPIDTQNIKRLQSAVAACTQHFKQPLPGGVSRHSLGNDTTNRDIVRLVRGELCTAVALVFLDGFKSFKFVGRYHIWDFLEKCLEFRSSPDKHKRGLAEGVAAVKGMDEYMKGKNDLKFRALVCYGLNHNSLHEWVFALDPDEPLVQKWYDSWAYLRNDMAREMIVHSLQPLAQETFELALDYELAMWDL